MDRLTLLIAMMEELIKETAERIGWKIDGSEIDYVTSMPEWEEMIKEKSIRKQTNDLIYIIDTWAYDTKRNCM